MGFSWDGMNIEIRKLQFIFHEKIEDDTNILLVNQVEVNQYLSGILHVKISGQGMESELLILMEISSKISFLLHQKKEPKI